MDAEVIMWVKGSTDTTALAATVAHKIYDGEKVVLRAIGAAAVNQTVKAIAIAQSYVGARGIIISMRPGFADVEMPDGTVTAIVFRILINES